MNTLLLIVLISGAPGDGPGCQQVPALAAYPDAGPAHGGPSHQGRHRLFGHLWGHRHDSKCGCAGSGHADGGGVAAAPQPAPIIEADPVVEAVTPEPVPTVAAPPAVLAPAPAVVAPPPAAPAPAPRLVPVPQRVTASAAPPPAAPPDGAPRQMPRGPAVPTGAEPPRN